MKTRLGFVSNSSSSSFVLIGKEISFEDVDDYKSVWFIGSSLTEGVEAFELDDKFKTKYKGKEFQDCEFYAVKKVVNEGNGEALTLEEINSLEPGDMIYTFEVDYHDRWSSGDYEEFEEDYLDEEEE